MSKLDTKHVINLDLVKDRVNSVIKFGLADVETSDFYLGLYNNGSRVFDKDYIVTLYIVKPNGTFRNIELEPKEGLKKYYCNLPDTLKNIPGEYLCQAIIFDNLTGEKKISKSKFKYSVDLDLASEMAGIIDEEEQESILTNILNRLLTLENPVEPYATQKHVDECVSTLTEEIDTIEVKDIEQDGKLSNIETKNIEQDDRLTDVETKDTEQDERLANIESKNTEQDNRLISVETKDTEQDGRLTTIEAKDVVQDGRLDSLENKVDGIDEKIIDTIEPTLDNHGNRVDALENKDLVHELRMTDIESKNVEQDNRLDALEVKDIAHESRMTDIESKNIEQDERLSNIESKNTEQDGRLDVVENKNQQQDSRLDVVESKNTQQDNRLDTIEGIDVAQNSRLDAIEVKNQQQDDRLLDVEKVNKRQDMDLKCLFAESKNNMIDVTEEGNSIYLQNSTVGYTLIDEIQGNTMVNCNKEADKEIILNGNINTQGYSNVTLTEGVDGGLVDIALEGNTMVNVCDQKDPVAITKNYTVETGNHVALQGEYDGKCRPVVTGNTLVNVFNRYTKLIEDNTFQKTAFIPVTKNTYYTIIVNTIENAKYAIFNSDASVVIIDYTYDNVIRFNSGENERILLYAKCFNSDGTVNSNGNIGDKWKKVIILEGDYTNKPIPGYFKGLQSSFEDNLVTQEMVDAGEELAENLGKYKVDYVISKEDGTIGQTKTFYLNSPLLEGDTIEQQGDNVVHVHRYKEVVLDGSDDEGWNKTNSTDEGYSRFYSGATLTSDKALYGLVTSDKLPTSIETYLQGDLFNCIGGNSGNNRINIKLTGDLTVEEFNSYLQSNPITAIYKLATPQYEVISTNDTILCDSYVNGHLDVDSVVPIKKVEFNNWNKELMYLYPNTEYTVQFESDNSGILYNLNIAGVNAEYLSIVKGINKFNITTGSNLPHKVLVTNGIGFNASNIVVTEATDQDFGYFEGMKSVGECEELEVVSSNSDGTLSNTQTLTHEPLRAVGDIKDKYVLIDGKWYICRKCGEVVLDGSDDEGWTLNESLDDTKPKYFIMLSNNFNFGLNYEQQICNRMSIGNPYENYNQNIICAVNDSVRIRKDELDTVNNLKLFLQQNPITIVYQLQTPQYEPIDYNPFEVYSDTTHISNNSTIPCNMTIKNTGYNCLLKPSTTYTVSSNLGLNTVTTPSTLTEDCLRFMDTDTSDVTTMRDVLVLEGDWTTKADLIPANFSGIESAFEQEYDAEKGKYKVNVKVANEDKTKENNITFYINEPLRGIGNVKDKVYVKNDKVVVERNCGSVTFDGSDDENWVVEGFVNKTLSCSYLFAKDKLNLCSRLLHCDTLPVTEVYNKDNEGIDIHFNLALHIRVHISRLSTKDVAGFKQWLQQNPTTIVYQLAEPTYEEIEYNDTKLFIESFKNSTLSYNSNVPVTSKLYYSYSVPIVDTVAQTASVSDEQDQLIIDLATQCAVMEMYLM